ncbi:glycosyl hydrolase family 28-related protein [Limisphaera sp. 4302-co]|uniref:glycosyl hydrolase family 28-related protein n=1 Tax=Limisphaera sp. 4302-co TaxID=3400417 RepID=UPI003C20AF1D
MRTSWRPLVRLGVVWGCALAWTTNAAVTDRWNVLDYGAVPDGRTDCTAAFQRALDEAGRQGGGVVYAPRGQYRFEGSLQVPPGVTLRGVWESVPAHNGIRDRGLPKPTDDGTTFLVTGGAGSEDGPPFITLNHNSTLKGVVIYYPDQDPELEPRPYPWAIAMRGKNPAVLAVELLNPYQGIDASNNERHLIRDVHGQPLRRGIYVDAIYDIGRIENVHFNPWWSLRPRLRAWQQENGEAFIFGRSDWQYVFNTFCFGYNVGYKFIATRAGVCNGNFLGIGADDCYTAVMVEQSAPYGLLISNGEFVSFNGPDPTMVRVDARHTGTVRFVNCAFWGPCNQIARVSGQGTVGFSDCTFVQWDRNNEGRHALQIESGRVLVRGCEFQAAKPQVSLGEGVQRAVVTGNLMRGRLAIRAPARPGIVVRDNAAEDSP